MGQHISPIFKGHAVHKVWLLKIRLPCYPKISVTNYQPKPCKRTARTSKVLHTGPIIPSFLWILQLYDTAHIHIVGSVASLADADRSSCCTNIVCFCIISCSTRQCSGNATPVHRAKKNSYNEIRPYNTTPFIIFRPRKMPTQNMLNFVTILKQSTFFTYE